MQDFDTSKGHQSIYLTRATRRLLEAELNADIEVRENIRAVEPGERVQLEDMTLQLVPANHMLGAVQVAVTLPDGVRVGYSGDIGWPVEHPIKVDLLVLDSTNGSPERIRRYAQTDAEQKFIELVAEKLRFGSVHVHAHRGTLHRALQALATELRVPVIASPNRMRELEVYREFAYSMPQIIASDAPAATSARRGRCLYIYSKGDLRPREYPRGDTSISLSAYMCTRDSPVLTFSDNSYRVAMSDHADYVGILEYVGATGAKHVIVDGIRGGHGLELATALRDELKISAEEFAGAVTREWGV